MGNETPRSTPDRPTVLMLIPNVDFGGAQRVFHDHSELLARDFNVVEVCFNPDGGRAYPTANRLISLDIGGGGGPFRKLANLVARIRALRAVKRQLDVRVTISHLEGAHYVSILSGGRDRKLLCIHGSLLKDRALGAVRGALVRRLLVPLLHRRADRIVTVSHEIADELKQLGVPSRLISTIHNFFDAAAIRAKASEGIDPALEPLFRYPVLVTSGRLALQKCQAPLLEILHDLLERRAAKLMILGDGELRDDLLRHAKALGLRVWDAWSGSVIDEGFDVYFMGFQDNPFPYLARSRLFLLSSAWEGFPMAIGEAMACGLPVVATDCATGPREFLAPRSGRRPAIPIARAEDSEFGVLMPMLDDRASYGAAIGTWVDTIEGLLGNPERLDRLAKTSRRRAEDFSVEQCGALWRQTVAALATSANSAR